MNKQQRPSGKKPQQIPPELARYKMPMVVIAVLVFAAGAVALFWGKDVAGMFADPHQLGSGTVKVGECFAHGTVRQCDAEVVSWQGDQFDKGDQVGMLSRSDHSGTIEVVGRTQRGITNERGHSHYTHENLVVTPSGDYVMPTAMRVVYFVGGIVLVFVVMMLISKLYWSVVMGRHRQQ